CASDAEKLRPIPRDTESVSPKGVRPIPDDAFRARLERDGVEHTGDAGETQFAPRKVLPHVFAGQTEAAEGNEFAGMRESRHVAWCGQNRNIRWIACRDPRFKPHERAVATSRVLDLDARAGVDVDETEPEICMIA